MTVSAILLVAAVELGLGGEPKAQVASARIGSWRTWLPKSAESGGGVLDAFGVTGPFAAQSPAIKRWREPHTSLRWTRTALELIAKHQLNPLRAARILALLHAAMHDALVRGVREGGDERQAWIAVHRAASLVLADLFTQEPAERFEALGLAAAEAVRGAEEPGAAAMWAIGREVAADAGARARADSAERVWPVNRRPPPAPGRWRPTPPVNVFNPLEPLAGEWQPWVLASGGEIEPPEPVPYDSPRYADEVREVKRVADALTPLQKAVAEAWNLDRGTVTPAGVWSLKTIELAEEPQVDGATAVRVLAALSVAMADAFVACWHAKYEWWTVRPISVIRERHDPGFLSHLVTPAFPSYPSGHATASGAAEVVLAAFFPKKAEWLRGQAEEAAASRLLGGIHFRSDNEAGLELGRAVGRRVVERVLGARPPLQGATSADVRGPNPVAQ